MAFCTRCGSALPTDARFCPACGNAVDAPTPAAPPVDTRPTDAAPRPAPSAKPRPAEKRSSGAGGLILPVIIAVALFVILVMLWSQRDGPRPIAAPDRNEAPATAAKESATAPEPSASAAADATRTTIASLDAAFRDDPQGARTRYPGPITATGTVAGVTPGSNAALSLEGRTPFNFVVANVADATQIANLAKGSRVTLTCDRVTALAGTTILQGCALGE